MILPPCVAFVAVFHGMGFSVSPSYLHASDFFFGLLSVVGFRIISMSITKASKVSTLNFGLVRLVSLTRGL